MCLPPATRTGGEIRKSPAKAASWSGQRVGGGQKAVARFLPRRAGEPGMQEGWQTAPVRGGGKAGADARYPSGMRAAGRSMHLLLSRFSTEMDGRKGTPFPLGLLRKQPLGDMVNRHCSPAGHSSAQESVMDFLFFFVGIIAVICALTYIKKTSPNRHH